MSDLYISEHVWIMSRLVCHILNATLTAVQIWHKGQDYSSVLKQTTDVCCHHLLHQQFAELIQHNSCLVNPCLWNSITSIFQGKILIILTFQSHICLGRTFSMQNLRKVNFLKSDFSSFPGYLPLIFILWNSQVTQVDKFTGYLTIKFSEYGHQWNCKGNIYQSVHSSRFCGKLANGKEVVIVKSKQSLQNQQITRWDMNSLGLTSACPFIEEFKFCR